MADPYTTPPSLPTMGQRFARAMRAAGLFSAAIAALAVALVAQGSDGLHIHMLIATALGVGLSVMLAAALMTLVFLSNKSGHDAAAARDTRPDKDETE